MRLGAEPPGAAGMQLDQTRDMDSISALDDEEQRGVSRTVTQIHWLLLFLVLAYLLLGGSRGDAVASAAISSGLFFYAALVVAFRYAKVARHETRLKIAIETVGMVAFITWALHYTGGLDSPLASTYLLPVVTAALALGRAITIAELGFVALCQILVGAGSLDRHSTLPFFGALVAQLAPIALVAYVTMRFSAGIRYGLTRARHLSQTDELTGLFNRRGFVLVAERHFDHGARAGRPAGLLMIDSDNLKSINDTYGHEAGNLLLKQLAETMVAQLRGTDVAARYGGDEFVVLLRNTPVQGTLEVAERIRRAVEAKGFESDGVRVAATVSVGIACAPQDGRDVGTLIGQADRGLYRAKEEGRNRAIRVSSES